MRKLISLSLGLALVSMIVVALPASAGSAKVERDLGLCGMPGLQNGELVPIVGTRTHQVQNDNVMIMKCITADGLNDSNRTQHFSGFTCFVEITDGVWKEAEMSHATIDKNGKTKMTCKATMEPTLEETPEAE